MRTRQRLFCGAIATLFALAAVAVHAAERVGPLTLADSIDLALKRSVLAHAAQEAVREAEAQRKEAFSGFWPKLSTSYSYTRLNRDPAVTSPGSSLNLPAPIGVVTVPPSTYQAGTKENYSWSLEVRQPLYTGGALSAGYEASRLAEEIARFDQKVVELDLVLEVKIAYFNILKALRSREAARQSVERLTAHRETAQGFYDVGIIPRNDLLYAEVELANGRQSLLRAENGVELAKSRFNMLLRRPMDAPVEIQAVLNGPPFETPLDGCIAAAIEKRSEIRSHALRLELAKSQVKQARSDHYPSIGLVGNYTRFGDTPGVAGSPYRDPESWYLMGVANWSLWDGGKTRSRVEAGISRENQAADMLIHLREQIALEVKNAWLLLVEAEKQLLVTQKAIEQAEENFRISTERYREQVGTTTEVIDAQTLLTRTRSDHDNAVGDYRIRRARLERAIGFEAKEGLD